ncbi:MAG: DUF2975 domain-containing protein [Clostridium sp.]|nr:DUF2975 domain-containing protein [Clostridium sp.]
MWNKEKSVVLIHIMIKLFYFVVVLAAVLPIVIYQEVLFTNELLISFFAPLYISLPVGVAALVCLDRLLTNLKKNKVFCKDNVKHLNNLSICCFVAASIALVSLIVILACWLPQEGTMLFTAILFIPFFIMSIGEIFVGLVVRVVKNAFEAAIEIKDENDLTI